MPPVQGAALVLCIALGLPGTAGRARDATPASLWLVDEPAPMHTSVPIRASTGHADDFPILRYSIWARATTFPL